MTTSRAVKKRREIMRILADENMSGVTVAMLRDSGHDVVWVKEERPRTPDPDVLNWATRESRLLITFDKDFGTLSQRDGRPVPFGVILFRISDDLLADEADRLIAQNVNAQMEWPGYAQVDWAGYLWVINIRKRPAS